MKKILTFIVSFFTLALFVVSLTQPMNASAAGDTEVSLDFTEEGGNFFAFDGGQYSSTGKIKVEIKGLKSGDQASLTLSYDTAQLVVGALEGIKNNDFGVDFKYDFLSIGRSFLYELDDDYLFDTFKQKH